MVFGNAESVNTVVIKIKPLLSREVLPLHLFQNMNTMIYEYSQESCRFKCMHSFAHDRYHHLPPYPSIYVIYSMCITTNPTHQPIPAISTPTSNLNVLLPLHSPQGTGPPRPYQTSHIPHTNDLIRKHHPQHRQKPRLQLRHLTNRRLHRLTCTPAQMILFLGSAFPLRGNGVHGFVFGLLVFGAGGVVV